VKVFATYNIKGGVGKTATAVNLAYLSAREGARTLVWDLDPQGAATFYFRIKPKVKGGSRKLVRGKRSIDLTIRGTDFEGLDLLPADFSYRHMDIDLERTKRPHQQLARLLLPLALQYDHLFLDCPPSISLVSEGVFVASDILIVPTIPTTLSLRTLTQLYRHLEDQPSRKPQMLPFFCMVDRRKALHRQVTESAADLAVPLLETEIPYSSVVEQMGIRRAPLATFAAGSAAAKAYQTLWAEIREGSIL
jgi:cellulose biosynthesis protein BcsQ